jgi:hypothetical protein
MVFFTEVRVIDLIDRSGADLVYDELSGTYYAEAFFTYWADHEPTSMSGGVSG